MYSFSNEVTIIVMSGIVCTVHRIVSECGPFQGNIYPEDYIPASCVLGTKHSSC